MFFCSSIGLTGILIVVVVSAQRGRQPMAPPQFRAQGQPSPTNVTKVCKSQQCPQSCQGLCNAVPKLGCMPSCTDSCKVTCAVVLSGAALLSCQAACVDSSCPNFCKALLHQPCLPVCNSTCTSFCIGQGKSHPSSVMGSQG